MVQGGDSNNKSRARRIDGMAWKPTSAQLESSTSGGMSSFLSIALIVQYRILIRTSSGALQSERVFLMEKSVELRVMSARRPMVKVAYAMLRPRIVRYL